MKLPPTTDQQHDAVIQYAKTDHAQRGPDAWDAKTKVNLFGLACMELPYSSRTWVSAAASPSNI